jgi:hypothetical protein
VSNKKSGNPRRDEKFANTQTNFLSIQTVEVRSLKNMFIYDMPYSVRQRLVDILNVNDAWRELAGNLMGYDQVRLFYLCWFRISACDKNSLMQIQNALIFFYFNGV